MIELAPPILSPLYLLKRMQWSILGRLAGGGRSLLLDEKHTGLRAVGGGDLYEKGLGSRLGCERMVVGVNLGQS